MATPTVPATPEQSEAKIQALLNAPAGKPPAGVLPNFHDPSNMNGTIIFTVTFCMTIATLAVTMRMYAKLFLVRSMAYEDYVILVSWAVTVGLLVTSIMCAVHGGGVHIWDIKLKTFIDLLYWINANSVLYIVDICLIKISILMQYLRIFVPHRQVNMPLFIAIHVCIWSIAVFYLVNAVLTIVPCIPRQKAWNLLITGGHCINITALYQSSGVINVLTDFAILFLPMKPIWNLQMPLRRKISMIAIFATGALACIVSVIRTKYSWRVTETTDASVSEIVMGLWTWAEIAIGILISCVPVLPKFLKHFGSKIGRYLTLGSRTPTARTSYNKHVNRVFAKVRGVYDSEKYFPQQCDRPNSLALSTEPEDSKGLPKGKYITLNDLENPSDKRETTEIPTKRDDLENGIGAA